MTDIELTAGPSLLFAPSSSNLSVPAGINGAAKRALDLAIALVALVFVSPLLVFLWFAVRLSDGGHAIFKQKRYGLGGRIFTCYKFRSMAPDAEQRLQALLDNDRDAAEQWAKYRKLRYDPRITRIGAFLRKTSLDELPQLINIIKGDMSIVGPRPIVQSEIANYGECYVYYCATRPGITGLWQVSGRSDATYDQRVSLDVSYVRNWNLLLDVSILVRTVPAVLAAKGAC
jgi:exopolysaccharide production protein ExoY